MQPRKIFRMLLLSGVYAGVIGRKGFLCLLRGAGQLLRESFCSRFLYTCMSASAFCGEKTLMQINRAWTQELLELFHEGFQASF